MSDLGGAAARVKYGTIAVCSAIIAAILAASIPATAQTQAPLSKEEELKLKQRQLQQKKANDAQKPPQQQTTPPPTQKQFLPPRGDRAVAPPQGQPRPNVGSSQPVIKPGPAPIVPRRTSPPPPAVESMKKTTPPAPMGTTLPPTGTQPSTVSPTLRKQLPPQQATPGSPTTSPIVTPKSGVPGQPGSPPFLPGAAPSARTLKQFPGTQTPGALPKLGQPTPGKIVAPIAGPKQLDQVKQGRVQSVGKGGQTIIQEPGNRFIIKQGNSALIARNETMTIKTFAPNARTTRLSGGVSQTSFVRAGGTRVISETDASGRLLRRYKRDPSGRQIVLIDNRRFYRNLAIGVGAGLLTAAVIVALAPPVHALPRRRYIVEYVDASDDDLYETLIAPPVEGLERVYSLDEIRYSESVRARMRRIDLDTINFEFGSFEVTPDQYSKLERIARAMGRALDANPAEIFMIEGHTDSVGPEDDNLSLSDRRAEAVARILVEHFNIPVENLVTQGYGEQFLKIPTQEAERANRRVSVRRITPLLSQEAPN